MTLPTQTLLENYKSLRLIGDEKNVIQLLQGQLTSDINEVTEKNSQLSAMCNEKGFLIADMFVSKHESEFLLTLNDSKIEEVIQELAKYLPFYKLNFEIDNRFVTGSINNHGGNHCYFKSDKHSFNLVFCMDEINLDNYISPWKLAHWEEGIYFLEDFLIQKTRPQEVGFDKNRVSFTKGCYRGQEIVARMHYLSKKKNQIKLSQASEEIKSDKILTNQIKHNNLFWFLETVN